MNEQNGQRGRVDVNKVVEHLQGQVARLAGELALAHAYITQLEEQLHRDLEPAGDSS